MLRLRGYDLLKAVLIQDWFLIQSTSSGPPTILNTTCKGHPTPPTQTQVQTYTLPNFTHKNSMLVQTFTIFTTPMCTYTVSTTLKTLSHSESIYRNCDGDEFGDNGKYHLHLFPGKALCPPLTRVPSGGSVDSRLLQGLPSYTRWPHHGASPLQEGICPTG